MAGINDLFSSFGPAAKTKILLLGSSDSLPAHVMAQVRSLTIEHVSPAGLMRPEISRRPAQRGTDDSMLAPMRRWFFARKPDAGFVLTDFPATLLQAQVFDEWLDARDESLNAVFASDYRQPVAQHYRTLGLLVENDELSPSGDIAKEVA